jgi:hypothetical protein
MAYGIGQIVKIAKNPTALYLRENFVPRVLQDLVDGPHVALCHTAHAREVLPTQRMAIRQMNTKRIGTHDLWRAADHPIPLPQTPCTDQSDQRAERQKHKDQIRKSTLHPEGNAK